MSNSLDWARLKQLLGMRETVNRGLNLIENVQPVGIVADWRDLVTSPLGNRFAYHASVTTPAANDFLFEMFAGSSGGTFIDYLYCESFTAQTGWLVGFRADGIQLINLIGGGLAGNYNFTQEDPPLNKGGAQAVPVATVTPNMVNCGLQAYGFGSNPGASTPYSTGPLRPMYLAPGTSMRVRYAGALNNVFTVVCHWRELVSRKPQTFPSGQ